MLATLPDCEVKMRWAFFAKIWITLYIFISRNGRCFLGFICLSAWGSIEGTNKNVLGDPIQNHQWTYSKINFGRKKINTCMAVSTEMRNAIIIASVAGQKESQMIKWQSDSHSVLFTWSKCWGSADEFCYKTPLSDLLKSLLKYKIKN